MIGNKASGVAIESDVDADSHEIVLRKGNIPYLMDAVIKYSYPEESCVREWTTNAIDAHIEASTLAKMSDKELIRVGHQDPAAVRKYFEGYQAPNVEVKLTDNTFSVRDFGIGMSRDRMTRLFTQMFESTKRKTNDMHGFFGIGRFVGLGVSDSFHIETNYLGNKIVAVVRKDERGAPSLDIMHSGPTDDRNGTTMTVSIDNPRKFSEAVAKQLAYFTGVTISIDSVQISTDAGKMNNATIVKGKHFVARNNSPFKQVHAVMGHVSYPIDPDQIEFRGSGRYSWRYNARNTTLGLRFEIGELPITWNREQVQYTDEFKKLLNKRYLEAVTEVIERFKTEYGTPKSIKQMAMFTRAVNDMLFKVSDDVEVKLSDAHSEDARMAFPIPLTQKKTWIHKAFTGGDKLVHVWRRVEGDELKTKQEHTTENLYILMENGRKFALVSDELDRLEPYMGAWIADKLDHNDLVVKVPDMSAMRSIVLENVAKDSAFPHEEHGQMKCYSKGMLKRAEKAAEALRAEVKALLEERASFIVTPGCVPDDFVAAQKAKVQRKTTGVAKPEDGELKVLYSYGLDDEWRWITIDPSSKTMQSRYAKYYVYVTRSYISENTDCFSRLRRLVNRNSVMLIKVSEEAAKFMENNDRFVHISRIIEPGSRWELRSRELGTLTHLRDKLSNHSGRVLEVADKNGVWRKMLKRIDTLSSISMAHHELVEDDRGRSRFVVADTWNDDFTDSCRAFVDSVIHRDKLLRNINMHNYDVSPDLAQEIRFYLANKIPVSGKYFRMLSEKQEPSTASA